MDQTHECEGGHYARAGQAGEGYGCAFKVFRLSSSVFGEHGDRHVEAGQSRQATEDVEAEE